MGRYLERAERLCRLLQLQTEALVDRPVREIHFGWARIYGSMYQEPPVAGLQMGNDDYTLADSYTLGRSPDFRARQFPTRCGAASRWPARTRGRMRHCISAEMWTRMNLAYLKIREMSIQGHLERLSRELLRRDRRRGEHLYRRRGVHHVPRRGLELHAAWAIHRAGRSYRPRCSSPSWKPREE